MNRKKRDTTHPITSGRIMMEKECCATIHYVLCSSDFTDVVVIHPIDIDESEINVNTSNYTLPTKNEIRNAYLMQLK